MRYQRVAWHHLTGGLLDMSLALAEYVEGVGGGFFLATSPADAEYWAMMRSGNILQFEFSQEALDALESGGAELRPIPWAPGSPSFQGQEFFVPERAFDLFNSLLNAGDVVVKPFGGIP